jgi:hypothetical protein
VSQAQYITLQAWAEQKFNPAPHPNTLRRWVADGMIVPQPFKIGGTYMVPPNARHRDEPAPSRLMERIRGLSPA